MYILQVSDGVGFWQRVGNREIEASIGSIFGLFLSVRFSLVGDERNGQNGQAYFTLGPPRILACGRDVCSWWGKLGLRL